MTGLLPLAENSVGARSTRPGDVLTHYGGRTTEVTNTDAEGRLVLADALAYAVAELEPDVLVDIATLTGAMKIALGQRTGGFFANRRRARRHAAGRLAGEPASRCGGCRWRPTTRSGSPPRSPTPTTPAAARARSPPRCSCSTSPAACRGRTSTSPRSGTPPIDEFEYTKGATGFGARVLLHWLEQREPLAGVRG